MFLYCLQVLVKFSMNGDGELFHLDEILSGLNLSMACFQQMCIAAGCDYLKNLNGIGINRAFQMASHNGNVLNALKSKGADEEYCEKFKNAVKVFCHQTVFDMSTCSTIPLEIWDTNPSSDLQYICGLYPCHFRCFPLFLRVHSFGMIRIWISDLRTL